MPRTLRFHLDENCHPAIADGLRRRGIDVTTTIDTKLLGADDRTQAAYALKEGRVIITQDQDFLRLNASGEPHAGIAYCKKDTKSIGEMISALNRM